MAIPADQNNGARDQQNLAHQLQFGLNGIAQISGDQQRGSDAGQEFTDFRSDPTSFYESLPEQ